MGKRSEVKSGDVYGRLTVLREVSPKVSSGIAQRCVECVCECGKVGEYRLYSLRNGKTRSCGCYGREVAGSFAKKHGMSESPEYRIWRGMLHRCFNKDSSAYRHYGGRGISVCDRWRESFEAFYADMGPRPSRRHSIDRIDVNGNYCPENCRWATQKEQSRNTRFNHLIEHEGETKCVSEWAEIYGLSPSVLYGRLVQRGWTFAKSVSWPVGSKKWARSRHPHYQVPLQHRDDAWHREHKRLEVQRITRDRMELERNGDKLAKMHKVDAFDFKSQVDSLLVEGWTWSGAVLQTLRDMGALER